MTQPHHLLYYVDDDPDDLYFFKEATESIGENVRLFNDGYELLKAIQHPPPLPYIIFLDLNMPRISGFEVLSEIKNTAKSKDIPVVILSTAQTPHSINECRRLGANLYIIKPKTCGKIKKLIEDVIHMDLGKASRAEEDFVYRP